MDETLFEVKYICEARFFKHGEERPYETDTFHVGEFIPAESLRSAKDKVEVRMRKREMEESKTEESRRIEVKYSLKSLEEFKVEGYKIKLEKI